MYLKLLLALIFTISIRAFAQDIESKIDSTSLYYTLKYNVLRFDNNLINKEKVEYIDSLINSNYLEVNLIHDVEGFDNFLFFEIKPTQKDSFIKGSYITGYNKSTNLLYRLKGFLYNDFYYLYTSESKFETDYITNFFTSKLKKKFKKDHKVKGLDIDCLVDNLEKKENWRISCLAPNNEKLLIDSLGEAIW